MIKKDTISEYRESLNRVFIFIQKNLENKLTLEQMSEVAGFSQYHFHRIFSALVGEAPGEYINRIRLERVAGKLQSTTDSITRIALDAGYDTPAALTRAFRKRFDMTPSKFRNERSPFKINGSFPQLKFSLEEAQKMKPEIKTIPDQTVVFVRRTGKYSEAAKDSWGIIMKYAGRNNLLNEKSIFIGISHDDPDITETDKLRYDACVTIENEVFPQGEVGVQVVKGGKYAVFMHKGPYENLHDTYRAICGSWLPASGMKPRDLPCFEVYHNCEGEVPPEELKTEIYLPLE